MTDDELHEHAREKARQIMRVLADAVGVEVAANVLIRCALEDLLGADELVAREVFLSWAKERERSVRVH